MEEFYNICQRDQETTSAHNTHSMIFLAGRGSDARRKATIRSGFSELSRELDTNIQEAIATHLAVVQRDVDTLRNENVALESENRPQFRARLETAVREIRVQLDDAVAVFGGLAPSTS
ncbi:hypothetical protein CLCR_09243 [Cladophialophora carrionii]|uniref:Uncharacterized protein n=1 Tax=Cladophialophora carrionii TaxID=86049 RepID=A0A1C1CUK7_9EURO|nr:hypothetical protein CLCR_09243 [Cladophialophora carrionii]